MPKRLQKGRRERERGFDELRVQVLRLGRYGVLLVLDSVRVPPRHDHHAERRAVDLDGSTIWESDCAVCS